MNEDTKMFQMRQFFLNFTAGIAQDVTSSAIGANFFGPCLITALQDQYGIWILNSPHTPKHSSSQSILTPDVFQQVNWQVKTSLFLAAQVKTHSIMKDGEYIISGNTDALHLTKSQFDQLKNQKIKTVR